MNSIVLEVSPETLQSLRDRATRIGTTPERLASACLEDLSHRSDEQFLEAARKVLEKNAELYRRLA